MNISNLWAPGLNQIFYKIYYLFNVIHHPLANLATSFLISQIFMKTNDKESAFGNILKHLLGVFAEDGLGQFFFPNLVSFKLGLGTVLM